MLKHSGLLIAAVCVLSVSAGAQEMSAASSVVKVMMYPDSSQITRQASVDVKPGVWDIVFSDVPEIVREDTLTVSGSGTAECEILDAGVKKEYLEKSASERVKELQAELDKLNDELEVADGSLGVVSREKDFLDSLRLYSANQLPKEFVTKMPTPQELEATYSFIGAKYEEAAKNAFSLKRTMKDLNEKINKVKNELKDLSSSSQKETRRISIQVECRKGGKLDLQASYLINQARWYPEYDARVDYKKSSVDFVCLGTVSQTSGQDWTGVSAVLSTAKPSVYGKMPELFTWYIRPPAASMPRQAGIMRKEQVMAGVMYDKADSAALDLEEKETEYKYAVAEEKLTSVNYNISQKIDIRSDGAAHKVPVFEKTFPAEFYYSATPKLSPFSFLTAKMTNGEEQLLPAKVRIFLDNTYVGASAIDAVGKGEEVELFLGIDEGVKVKREKVRDETKDVLFAGIERRTKVVIQGYKLTVENYKDKAVKVNLFDNIPVAQSNQIVVKLLDSSLKPIDENYMDRQGVMRWEIGLKPGEKKEIEYTFQVEMPQGMEL